MTRAIRSRFRSPVPTALLLALALALTGITFFSEAPLWCDEVLQFAFGAYGSTAEAWHWVRTTAPSINMGQTGAYIMLDYWSLKAFGASRLAMRWPSLLSAIVLAVAAIRLLALWGVPWRWRVVAVLGVYGQSCLTDLIPNARYYLPLIAGSMAVGAFYHTPRPERAGGTFALGVAGMLLGGLFHPYFPLYAAGFCLLSFLWHVDAGRESWSVAAAWRHAAPHVWLPGAAAWYVIGKLTWMQGQPRWDTDVWTYTGHGPAAAWTWVTTMFEFIPGPFLGCAGLVLAAGVLQAVARERRSRGTDARAALGWVVFALGSSLLLSFVSWHRRYPIFLRQWSVSATMMPLGMAWLGAVVTRTWSPRAAALAAALALALTGARAGSHALRCWNLPPPPPPARPIPADVRPTDWPGWVELANRNCAEGGPVYPVFRTFYR